jgi:hypothetical protein
MPSDITTYKDMYESLLIYIDIGSYTATSTVCSRPVLPYIQMHTMSSVEYTHIYKNEHNIPSCLNHMQKLLWKTYMYASAFH